MHGIGEYRWATGEIYKGSFANDELNGIGFYWFPDGNLYQGNWKDDKLNGLQIIHYKDTGTTDEAELKDGLGEGLQAEHTSDGINW
jgi:hypothetical protein